MEPEMETIRTHARLNQVLKAPGAFPPMRLDPEFSSEVTKVDFSYKSLVGWDFSRCSLVGANFEGANLSGVDFSGSSLNRANFTQAENDVVDAPGVKFQEANLRDALFNWASLPFADFRGSQISGASFREALLYRSDFQGVEYHGGANFHGASLEGAKLPPSIAARLFVPPEEGSFIAWKKCMNGLIVKLRIPADAKRSSATTRKCRASKAEVLEIKDLSGKNYELASSTHDPHFHYRVGSVVEVENFCEDRWRECASGIHFYMTRQEAIDHK